jgi:hypothetical protein
MELVNRLKKCKARFYYDFKSIPCVDQQLHGEAVRGIAFSRYVQFSVPADLDEIDIMIDKITKHPRSISNCPYQLRALIKDQGLDCVFGNKDHQERFGGVLETIYKR